MTEQKSLVQMQAERMARSRFTDLMASAGVGYNQIAKEVFYFMPQELLDVYAELWHAGVAGKDDGGTGARGQADAEQARVGKASGKGLQGLGGAKRKTHKKYWVIADEDMLAIKDRADKRIRALARSLRLEMDQVRAARRNRGGDEEGSVSAVEAMRCSDCGRILQAGWKFCPNDGTSNSISEGQGE